MTQLQEGKRYQCRQCGYICTPEQMGADSVQAEDGVEEWSNQICPNCGAWNEPDDWKPIEEANEKQ
ncbi:MAG: rubredoxin [Mesorhizobium sp.]|nr:MAG: rubredoxin [Mesorhizobium sp.]